jgi:hypothetical protein
MPSIDNGKSYRRAALDDSSAHASYVVTDYARSTANRLRSASEQ